VLLTGCAVHSGHAAHTTAAPQVRRCSGPTRARPLTLALT
jgi:hypothetical protein